MPSQDRRTTSTDPMTTFHEALARQQELLAQLQLAQGPGLDTSRGNAEAVARMREQLEGAEAPEKPDSALEGLGPVAGKGEGSYQEGMLAAMFGEHGAFTGGYADGGVAAGGSWRQEVPVEKPRLVGTASKPAPPGPKTYASGAGPGRAPTSRAADPSLPPEEERKTYAGFGGRVGWGKEGFTGMVGAYDVAEANEEGEPERAHALQAGWSGGGPTMSGTMKAGGLEGGLTIAKDGFTGSLGTEHFGGFVGGDVSSNRAGSGKDEDELSREITGGDSSYVSLTSGSEGRAGLSLKNELVGAGASIAESESHTRAYHRTTEGPAEDRDMWDRLFSPGDSHLDGVDGLADVDVDKIDKGSLYSFEDRSNEARELSLAAGPAEVKWGDSSSRTRSDVLGRDQEGDLVGSSSSSTASSSSRGATLAGVIGGGDLHTTAHASEAAFVATGDAGKASAKEWQATGLMPDAAEVVRKVRPDVWAEYVRARDADLPDWMRRGQLRAATDAVNEAFRDSGVLPEAKDGVDYDHVTTTDVDARRSGGELFGHEIVSQGSTDVRSDTLYREDGKIHDAASADHTDANVFSADETSNIVVDGRDSDAALSMHSTAETGRGTRASLDALGAEEIAPDRRQAWLDSDGVDRIDVNLTDGQLDGLRDTLWRDRDDAAFPSDVTTGLVDEYAIGRGREERSAALVWGGDGHLGSQNMNFHTAAQDALQRAWEDSVAADAASGRTFDEERKEILDRVTSVRSAKEFADLAPGEQRLLAISVTVNAAKQGGNPWDGVRYALLVPDEKARSALLRDLYQVVEASKEGANAPILFVQYVQEECAKAGVSDGDVKNLLSGVHAEREDGSVDLKTSLVEKLDPKDPAAVQSLGYELLVSLDLRSGDGVLRGKADPKLAAEGFDGALAPRRGAASRPTELIRALRSAGGPALVERVLDEASHQFGSFDWIDTLDRIEREDVRQYKDLQFALRGTKYDPNTP